MHRSGLARLAKKGHKQGVQLGAIPKRDRGGAVRVILRKIGWNLLNLEERLAFTLGHPFSLPFSLSLGVLFGRVFTGA